jgi:drug/metabolite transporter superfamily protein YnfA
MTEAPSPDWDDLSKRWQADAAAVSIGDIDEYLRRERRQLRLMIVMELAGVGLGLLAAVWLTFFTPHRWLGVVVAIFAVVSAVFAVRMRREPPASGGIDVMSSLKESIGREDYIAEQLRLGRALSFVALFSIVMATASQMMKFHTISSVGLAAAIAGGCYVAGVVAWNLVLTRRARFRRDRLVYLHDRLKP